MCEKYQIIIYYEDCDLKLKATSVVIDEDSQQMYANRKWILSGTQKFSTGMDSPSFPSLIPYAWIVICYGVRASYYKF